MLTCVCLNTWVVMVASHYLGSFTYHLTLSPVRRHNVYREIRLHGGLQHPNIVQLYVAFEDESDVYLVQEYLPTGDLFKNYKYHGEGYFREKAAKLIEPLLHALVYLHQEKVRRAHGCSASNLILFCRLPTQWSSGHPS